MEFASNPALGQVYSERTGEEIGNFLNNNPISGGVVQDSSSNIINMSGQSGGSGRGEDSYTEYLDWKLKNPMKNTLSYADWLNIYSIPAHNSGITANDLLNDVTRGETSNLESPENYLERITGIIADGIYTAKEQNALNLNDAERTREYNAFEAEKARAFQLMLRDTQIQSTMKQLKDAGINPLLALSGSLGYANASTSAQASSNHANFGNDNSIMSALIIAVASILGSALKSFGGFGKLFEVLG